MAHGVILKRITWKAYSALKIIGYGVKIEIRDDDRKPECFSLFPPLRITELKMMKQLLSWQD
jgi:hypothetical protein